MSFRLCFCEIMRSLLTLRAQGNCRRTGRNRLLDLIETLHYSGGHTFFLWNLVNTGMQAQRWQLALAFGAVRPRRARTSASVSSGLLKVTWSRSGRTFGRILWSCVWLHFKCSVFCNVFCYFFPSQHWILNTQNTLMLSEHYILWIVKRIKNLSSTLVYSIWTYLP